MSVLWQRKTKTIRKGNYKLQCQIKTLAIAINELYEDIGSKSHPGVIKIIDTFNKEYNDK